MSDQKRSRSTENDRKATTPVFSILMPVFNAESFIRESLESVLSQKFYDWELIIVNDGSTDGSRGICEEYAARDERIRLIDQRNEGQLSARRTGICAAKGQFSIFLDADDLLESTCLEKLYRVLSAHHPDIVMYTGYLYMGPGEKTRMEVSFEEGWIDKARIYEKILSSDEINAIWTKCIRTALLQEDRTDYTQFYTCSYGEDKLQFFYPVTKAERVYYLPEFLYDYRQNPCSMIHNVSVSVLEKKLHLEVWDMLFQYAQKWDMWDSEHQIQMGTYFFKHMIHTFSTVYAAGSYEDKRLCRMYDWNAVIPDFLPKADCKKRLSIKERMKLFSILHNSKFFWELKKIYR